MEVTKISRKETFNEKGGQEKSSMKVSKNGDITYNKRLSKDDEKYADLGIRKASEEFGVGVEYLLWKKWTLKSQVFICIVGHPIILFKVVEKDNFSAKKKIICGQISCKAQLIFVTHFVTYFAADFTQTQL